VSAGSAGRAGYASAISPRFALPSLPPPSFPSIAPPFSSSASLISLAPLSPSRPHLPHVLISLAPSPPSRSGSLTSDLTVPASAFCFAPIVHPRHGPPQKRICRPIVVLRFAPLRVALRLAKPSLTLAASSTSRPTLAPARSASSSVPPLPRSRAACTVLTRTPRGSLLKRRDAETRSGVRRAHGLFVETGPTLTSALASVPPHHPHIAPPIAPFTCLLACRPNPNPKSDQRPDTVRCGPHRYGFLLISQTRFETTQRHPPESSHLPPFLGTLLYHYAPMHLYLKLITSRF
jgi:hypothetical protein